jgi:hypothetical protein
MQGSQQAVKSKAVESGTSTQQQQLVLEPSVTNICKAIQSDPSMQPQRPTEPRIGKFKSSM